MSRKKKRQQRPLPQDLGLPPLGIDTHAHLDLEDFAGDLQEVLARAREAGVVRIGNVLLGPRAYIESAALLASCPQVFLILGVHPNSASELDGSALQALREAVAGDERIRAVGEIGLDFYWDHTPPNRQREAFVAQLALARELSRPVVIHCRSAEQETLAILLQRGFCGYPLLWHCFGGDLELARAILASGWHLAIPGTVTYAKNQALRQVVAELPPDRLLLETDCPYLPPEPYRGKRNEPALVVFTAAAVAAARGSSTKEVWEQCAANAVRFFGLDKDPPEGS